MKRFEIFGFGLHRGRLFPATQAVQQPEAMKEQLLCFQTLDATVKRENHYSTYSQAFKGDARRQTRKLNASYFLSHPYESNLNNAEGGKVIRTSASPFPASADAQHGQILHWQQQWPIAKGCIGHLCESLTQR